MKLMLMVSYSSSSWFVCYPLLIFIFFTAYLYFIVAHCVTLKVFMNAFC